MATNNNFFIVGVGQGLFRATRNPTYQGDNYNHQQQGKGTALCWFPTPLVHKRNFGRHLSLWLLEANASTDTLHTSYLSWPWHSRASGAFTWTEMLHCFPEIGCSANEKSLPLLNPTTGPLDEKVKESGSTKELQRHKSYAYLNSNIIVTN